MALGRWTIGGYEVSADGYDWVKASDVLAENERLKGVVEDNGLTIGKLMVELAEAKDEIERLLGVIKEAANRENGYVAEIELLKAEISYWMRT